MIKNILRLSIVVFFLVLGITVQGEQLMLSYGGTLVHDGSSVTGTVPMVFQIYDGMDGTNVLYEESKDVVLHKGGFYWAEFGYSAKDGEISAVLKQTNAHIQVTVNGKKLSREKFEKREQPSCNGKCIFPIPHLIDEHTNDSCTIPPAAVRQMQDSGYPVIADGTFVEKIRLATSPDTPDKVRFDAVWGLAISGYTKESTLALAQVTAERGASDTTRGYAAMGLRNFTASIPSDLKHDSQKVLQGVITAEGYDAPDGIMRTLIAWGDAPFILETLGTEAEGHPMEVEILAGLTGDGGFERLLQLYETCRKGRRSYNERSEIGRALVMKRDKRGVDILMELLPSDGSPGGQHRHNTFAFLTKYVTGGSTFGYNALNYDPSLDEAVPKMLSWWQESRRDFVFDSASQKK